MRTGRKIASTWIGFWLLVQNCFATNGLNLIGFGAESNGMAGADIAVARDTSALNTNPAGLAQITERRMDFAPFLAFALDVTHSDTFSGTNDVQNSPLLGASGGYARRLEKWPVTVGMGLFTQGGAGADYENIATPFGTRDDLTSILGILRLSPGFGWQVNDRFSFGASAIATMVTLNQKFFPSTSVLNAANPAQSFLGYELKNAYGLGFAGKIGAMFKATPWLTLGVEYTTPTEIDVDVLGRGHLFSNQTALGRGIVEYGDVDLTGIRLPQELAFGVAVRPADKLLLSAQVKWLDWSRAVTSSTLTVSDPNTPAIASTLSQTAVNNWRDQYVYAVGFAYDCNDRLTIRAGYNYGANPISSDRLSPFLAAIAEHHAAIGASYRYSARWEFSGALEYDLPNHVTYNNPQLPFGPNTRESGEVLALHAMISRVW